MDVRKEREEDIRGRDVKATGRVMGTEVSDVLLKESGVLREEGQETAWK